MHVQILRVINPKCGYSVGDSGKKHTGVAIMLKQFLKVLDRNDIPHEDETCLRKKLRRRADVKTTATQYFLSNKTEGNKIIRENSVGHSCMIIPHSDVPQQFFEILESRIDDKEGNAYLHSQTLYITLLFCYCRG